MLLSRRKSQLIFWIWRARSAVRGGDGHDFVVATENVSVWTELYIEAGGCLSDADVTEAIESLEDTVRQAGQRAMEAHRDRTSN